MSPIVMFGHTVYDYSYSAFPFVIGFVRDLVMLFTIAVVLLRDPHEIIQARSHRQGRGMWIEKKVILIHHATEII